MSAHRRVVDAKPEIMRCLKRYVARELFPLIQAIATPTAAETDDIRIEPRLDNKRRFASRAACGPVRRHPEGR